jgi:hypothetical protein
MEADPKYKPYVYVSLVRSVPIKFFTDGPLKNFSCRKHCISLNLTKMNDYLFIFT